MLGRNDHTSGHQECGAILFSMVIPTEAGIQALFLDCFASCESGFRQNDGFGSPIRVEGKFRGYDEIIRFVFTLTHVHFVHIFPILAWPIGEGFQPSPSGTLI